MDQPANPASVSDTDDATTEDTESGDEDMCPEPIMTSTFKPPSSPSRAQYPGTKMIIILHFLSLFIFLQFVKMLQVHSTY